MARRIIARLCNLVRRRRWILAGFGCGGFALISLLFGAPILSAASPEKEVRVAFGEVELHIPTEYFGTVTPAISKDAEKVTIVTVVLYPEMRPIDRKNSAEFAKLGWGLKIDIEILIGRKKSWGNYLNNMAKLDYDFSDHNYEESDIDGFSGHFTRSNGTFAGEDFYYDGPLSEPTRRMTCKQEHSVPSPSCKIYIGLKHGFTVQVTFARNLLSSREQISSSVIDLLGSWSVSPIPLEVE